MSGSIPFYDSTREYRERKAEFDAAVQSVMSRGDFILGGEVAEFEKEAAAFLGARHAVGVASGSDALVLGADILGFRDGAEVLTPVFTFFASASCIARLGGRPVFVDMDEETLNMDLAQAERKATRATKGIVPVHLFLQPTPMQRTADLARSRGLKILEDAAEAWGMEGLVDGAWRKAGTTGDIGVFSFFPTKTLGAYGDAGLMTTEDDETAAKIRSYRVHGSSVKYFHDYVGYNSRLDTLQAAILRVKLKTTEKAISERARHAAHYTERLSSIPGLRIPAVKEGGRSVYYVYNILVPRRDELAAALKEKGIGWSIYYPRPLHLQKCFAYLGHRQGDFPVAERICGEILALPMYPELRDDEVDAVCDAIASFYGKRG
jgi:UDP-2-acetamido-2-deoxy-ribo-hexuluronate aminotransferase